MAKSFPPLDLGDQLVQTPKRAAPQKRKSSAQKGPAPKKSPPKGKRPSAASIWFLNIWHGIFSGGFFVAMLTGDGLYNAHVFSGVLVLFAIGLRLMVGLMFPKGHVLLFPFPSFKSLAQGTNGFRRFVSHLMGLALIIAVGFAAVTGWISRDNVDAHSAISYMTLALIGGHVALVIVWQGWKKVESKFSART